MPRKRTRPRDLMVAESESMRRVVSAVEALMESDAPVLILGEAGTGRELIARLLHFGGPRAGGEFVPVEAGAAPREIFDDLIACSADSAFRMAAGGTLLVKELCELSRESQRKLSRVLRVRDEHRADDTGESWDVRILGASDPELTDAVDAGVFARALYERLSANRIVVPPLRERADDIPALAGHFIRRYAKELSRGKLSVSTRAYERLRSYPWPGNVTELKWFARRLVLRCRTGRIEAGDVDAVLPVVAERVPLEQMSFEDMVRSQIAAFLRRVDGYPITGVYDDMVARVERPLLDLIMEHTGGNQVRAADILGVNRNTLRRKLSEHGIRSRARAAAAPVRSRKRKPKVG